MKKLFIFGCSFSAEYSLDALSFPAGYDYILREAKEGNTEVETVGYCLSKEFNQEVEIINLAKGGYSNDEIFHQFFLHSKNIQPGDFAVLQLSILGRFRALTKNSKKWINFSTPVSSLEVVNTLENKTFYTREMTNSIALERSLDKWKDYVEDTIKFIQHYCEKSKIKLCTISLDKHIDTSILDIPFIYMPDNVLTIERKYKDIPDKHPTYEGNRNIAKLVANCLKAKVD